MANLSLREFQPDDLPAVLRLIRDNFNPDYSQKRWEWLYSRDANLGSRIILAESEGRVVGKVGLIRKRFRYNGETLTCGRCLDPVVDRSMRGQGVFTRMLAAMEASNDVDFTYAFPNAKSFPGFLKAGFSYLGPINMPKCQLRFMNTPPKEKLRFFYTGARVALSRNGASVEEADFDILREQVPRMPRDRFYLARDYAYLRWRYAESPIREYRLLVIRDGGELQNACVIAPGPGRVAIVDLMTYAAPIHLPAYLSAIKRMYGKVTVNMWNSSLESVDDYFYGKSVQHFVVRPHASRMADKLLNLKRWYLTKGEVESN